MQDGENRIEFFSQKTNLIENIKNEGSELYVKMVTNFKDRRLKISPYSHKEFYIRNVIRKFDNGFILFENNKIVEIAFLDSPPFSKDVIISIISDEQIKIIKLIQQIKKFCKNREIYDLITYILPFEGLVQTFKNCGFQETEEMFDLIEIVSVKMIYKLK